MPPARRRSLPPVDGCQDRCLHSSSSRRGPVEVVKTDNGMVISGSTQPPVKCSCRIVTSWLPTMSTRTFSASTDHWGARGDLTRAIARRLTPWKPATGASTACWWTA